MLATSKTKGQKAGARNNDPRGLKEQGKGLTAHGQTVVKTQEEEGRGKKKRRGGRSKRKEGRRWEGRRGEGGEEKSCFITIGTRTSRRKQG